MKKMVILLLVFSAFVSASEGWMTDFKAAAEKATKENKPIFANFTGSDWCIWCIKLEREVLSKKAFKEFAKDNLVLLMLDFPSKKKQDPELKKQNKKLADKYKIKGFPTILILNGKGEIIAETGYQPGGAEEYVKHLQALLAPKKETHKHE